VRNLIVLTLMLASSAANAQQWIVLRGTPAAGESAPAGILIDAASVEILSTGIRRATSKVDFLSRRLQTEYPPPTALSYMIVRKLYDCAKQLRHEDSYEFHLTDGSVNTIDRSSDPKWYPFPSNLAADPTIDFVCKWKPT
jgi:hypothetical protein